MLNQNKENISPTANGSIKDNSVTSNQRYKKFYYIAFLMPLALPIIVMSIYFFICLFFINHTSTIYIDTKIIDFIAQKLFLSLVFGGIPYLIYLMYAIVTINQSNTRKDLYFLIYLSPLLFSIIAPTWALAVSGFDFGFYFDLIKNGLPICYLYVLFTELTYKLLNKKH